MEKSDSNIGDERAIQQVYTVYRSINHFIYCCRIPPFRMVELRMAGEFMIQDPYTDRRYGTPNRRTGTRSTENKACTVFPDFPKKRV